MLVPLDWSGCDTDYFFIGGSLVKTRLSNYQVAIRYNLSGNYPFDYDPARWLQRGGPPLFSVRLLGSTSAINSMVAMLPVSRGGIGIAEAMYVLLFLLAGLSNETALALALFMRALGLVVPLPGPALFLMPAVGAVARVTVTPPKKSLRRCISWYACVSTM